MANRYWVGGTDNWDATAGTKWSLTSGGAGGQAVPTSSDDVYFDASSGTGTVTCSVTSYCKSLNFTGFTGTFAGSGGIVLYGDLTLGSGMTLTSTSLIMISGAYSHSITTNGKTIKGTVRTSTTGGTYTLQDDFVSTGSLELSSGSFYANNKNITCKAIYCPMSASTDSIHMGSGTWTLTGGVFNAGGYQNWSAMGASATLYKDTSNIVITGSMATRNVIFDGGGKIFNNIWINTTSNTYSNIIKGSNTFNEFKASSGTKVVFSTDSTQNVSTLNINGTIGNLVTISSGKGSPSGEIVTWALYNGGSGYSAYQSIFLGTPYGEGVPEFQVTAVSGGVITALTMKKAGYGQTVGVKSSEIGWGSGAGATVEILSVTGGATNATISDSSGINNLTYTNITGLTASGGATFNAFTTNGNVDGGNNSGWDFGLSPSQAGFLFNMI